MDEHNQLTPYVTQDEHRQAIAEVCQDVLIDVYALRQDIRALTWTVQNFTDEIHIQMQGFRHEVREGFDGIHEDLGGIRQEMQDFKQDMRKFTRTLQVQTWIVVALMLVLGVMIALA